MKKLLVFYFLSLNALLVYHTFCLSLEPTETQYQNTPTFTKLLIGYEGLEEDLMAKLRRANKDIDCLEVTHHVVNSQALRFIVTSFPHLRHLIIENGFLRSDDLTFLAQNLIHLTELSLKGSNEFNALSLISVTTFLPSLEVLVLYGKDNSFTSENLVALSQLTNLTYLALEGENNFFDAHSLTLLKTSLTHIKDLRVQGEHNYFGAE
jgi:hypothetical protein